MPADPKTLKDWELETLDDKVQQELRSRGRRVGWTDYGRRQALALMAQKGLGQKAQDVSFACSESNHLVIASRMEGGGILYYHCMVVACEANYDATEEK